MIINKKTNVNMVGFCMFKQILQNTDIDRVYETTLYFIS